ncbi:hypothetical protein ACFYN3_42235 [Streptomyces lavendulae]|uniref:hypothetical protein n=1 Tax=Streptomyces lavendulae TaxID=1914 RepID=UPI0033F3809E
MRQSLVATRSAAATTAGTITLDSFTRTSRHDTARELVAQGFALNGYPLIVHDARTTRMVLNGVHDASFPVQVRHGCPGPQDIFAKMIDAGIGATEGVKFSP